MINYAVSDRTATITIDDEARRNPLSNEAMVELTEAVSRSAADPDVSVVVITGAGDRAFPQGAISRLASSTRRFLTISPGGLSLNCSSRFVAIRSRSSHGSTVLPWAAASVSPSCATSQSR